MCRMLIYGDGDGDTENSKKSWPEFIGSPHSEWYPALHITSFFSEGCYDEKIEFQTEKKLKKEYNKTWIQIAQKYANNFLLTLDGGRSKERDGRGRNINRKAIKHSKEEDL